MAELNLEQLTKSYERKLCILFNEVKAIRDSGRAAQADAKGIPAFKGKFRALDTYAAQYYSGWDVLYDAYLAKNLETSFPIDDKKLSAFRGYVYECYTVYDAITTPSVPTRLQEASHSTLREQETSMSPNISVAGMARYRLPKLQLPKFGGELMEWPQFRDIFISIVHEEPSLDPIERYHHLVSSLTEEPLRIVSTFSITGDNYTHAWKALMDRYNNKRVLAAHYLNRVQQFKPSNPSTSSSAYLRSYLKQVADAFTAFNSLKIADEANFFKLQTALDCLDSENRQLFEEKQQANEFPTYESLIEFIQQRCKILELSEPSTHAASNLSSTPVDSIKRRPKVLATFSDQTKCPRCGKNHLLFRCFVFKKMSYDQRNEFVKSKDICTNCLRKGHSGAQCSSSYSCIHCNDRHHSLLHIQPPSSCPSHPSSSGQQAVASQLANVEVSTQDQLHTGVVGTTAGNNTVLLGTAVVNIADWKGEWHSIRIVVDSGSQFSLMTEACARRLGIPWSPCKKTMCGVGLTNLPKSKGTIRVTLSPTTDSGKMIAAQAIVMPALTSSLPSISLDRSVLAPFNSLHLADAEFWRSRPVDFLLGSDLFLRIVSPEPMVKIADNFGTLPTVFGHIVIGVPPNPSIEVTQETCLALTDSPISDDILRAFWEIEEAAPSEKSHPDDEMCESIFQSNVQRLSNGRYMVALPLRQSITEYPSSRSLAFTRFCHLEQKFGKDPQLKKHYSDFITEYIDFKHMEIASSPSCYVIPHHAVFKRNFNSSQPGKIRVVFDASMQTSSGSLNDNLLTGTKLQKDIFSIIMNFRRHKIGFCTDIVKMFRQILLKPEHRGYQHVLWRFNPEDALQTYELRTVTYGQSSSPYLALRVLIQLANDERDSFPKASDVLKRDVYVDDIITGADSLEEALELKQQIVHLLEKGCFPVHKWASNSPEILGSIATEQKNNKVELTPDDVVTKILGMHWDSISDCFQFKVNMSSSKITKRSMLSIVARLFDPLGFLAPIIFVAKHMIQGLWSINLDWDDPLPSHLLRAWTAFIRDLPRIEDIRIPRWVRTSEGTKKIFGFCDASEKGYAAAIYLQITTTNHSVQSYLLTAKTRLAPLRTVSIPRLELCGAQLLVRLLVSLKEFCDNCGIREVLLFTDSTIVLSWLHLSPHQLKTFVANRTSYILSHTLIHQWNHTPSSENPADIASRGIPPAALVNYKLWWNGPDWMGVYPLILPITPSVLNDVPERKIHHQILIATEESENLVSILMNKFSRISPLVRAVAHVFRFINNTIARIRQQREPLVGPLQRDELDSAMTHLIKDMQRGFFGSDYEFSCKRCSSTRFRALAVFEDTRGVLRVGGRLSNSPLAYDAKHPIVLHPKARLTELITDGMHIQNFHLGPKALQAHLQRKYYVFGVKSYVRKRVWTCLRCFKLKAKPNNPLMGDLPMSRVSQGRPFTSVGVDFAGPFMIKLSTRRNSPLTKAYLSLFVCMATKSVHLEVVSSMTTDAFLAAFDRFTARRGLPTEVRSDCGTTFIGAARHLTEIVEWHTGKYTRDKIARHASDLGVQWHFNPPYAPNFGGLWEAAVKSAKFHLKATLGDRPFYFEELNTIFCRIEAILNSRPLCPISADVNDLDPLTPGHFLIGSALIAHPEVDLSDTAMSRQSRWQLLQAATQSFWKRWTNEYIQTLQRRLKWTKHAAPVKIDDLVIIQDPTSMPLNWKLGRVVDLHPGPDGTTRVVTLRTSNGNVTRPVNRLAPLDPINTTNN